MFPSSRSSDESSSHSWSQVSRASSVSEYFSADGSADSKIGDFVFVDGRSNSQGLSKVDPMHSHQRGATDEVKSSGSMGSRSLRDAIAMFSKLDVIEPIASDHPLNKLLRKLSAQMNALRRSQPNLNIENAIDKHLDKVKMLERLLAFTQRAIAFAKTSNAQQVNAELGGFFKEMERFEVEMASVPSKRIRSKTTKEVLEIKRALSMGKLSE